MCEVCVVSWWQQAASVIVNLWLTYLNIYSRLLTWAVYYELLLLRKAEDLFIINLMETYSLMHAGRGYFQRSHQRSERRNRGTTLLLPSLLPQSWLQMNLVMSKSLKTLLQCSRLLESVQYSFLWIWMIRSNDSDIGLDHEGSITYNEGLALIWISGINRWMRHSWRSWDSGKAVLVLQSLFCRSRMHTWTGYCNAHWDLSTLGSEQVRFFFLQARTPSFFWKVRSILFVHTSSNLIWDCTTRVRDCGCQGIIFHPITS